MAGLPSSMGRVARDRPRLVAVALLALVSLAAAGISATAAERLQSLLDENWRGAYDILVTAGGGRVAGLLPPNSVASSSEGLTLADVATIRAVSGVEVAAPIGEVIIPMLAPRQAQFTLPSGYAGADETPQAFRVTVTYLTDDGLGERVISRESFEVVVDETERPAPEPASCNYNGFDVTPEQYPIIALKCGEAGDRRSTIIYPSGSGWSGHDEEEDGRLLFPLGDSLLSSTRVTLVDPAAERALLGEAGDFLEPLIALSKGGVAEPEAMVTWAEGSANRYTDAFLKQRDATKAVAVGIPEPELEELRRLYAANGATFPESDYEYEEPPYVPILARDVGSAPLSMRIEVEAFGDAPVSTPAPGEYLFPYILPAPLTDGGDGAVVGSETVEASALLNPFTPDPVFVPWPGTSAEGLAGQPWFGSLSIFITATAESPAFEVIAENADGVEVRVGTDEYVFPFFSGAAPGGSPVVLSSDGTRTGIESAYVSEFTARSGETSAQGAVVGGFTLDKIAASQSGLGHVPLGAYEAVGSTLIPGSSDAATEAVELRPSVSGLGLVSPDTVAIASLESAAQWGQKAPVNAVRVRVADVFGFSTDAVATIASVAQAIERLGYTATVVAGSSPTDVTVHVEGYSFGVTDPDEKQTVGPLGAVNQRWSELGAASRVDLAVSTSSLGVLAVALGASALLLAAVQLASVPGRRAQASVMRTIGWRRRRIVRWMAAEELVSLLIVVIAGVAALLLASSRSTVGLAVGASVAALVVTSALAVALGARPVDSGIRSLKRGRRRHRMADVAAWVVSPLRFALRQVSVHRVNVVVQLLATLVVAVAAAAVTVTVMEGRAAAGASALGLFAVDQALWAQLGLGLVALVAGIVLAVIARRIDLHRRREQWATMRAMGWSAGQVRGVQVIEGVLVGLPAIALAGALSWWYVRDLAADLLGTALPIALGAAAVLTVILVMTSWREKR